MINSEMINKNDLIIIEDVIVKHLLCDKESPSYKTVTSKIYNLNLLTLYTNSGKIKLNEIINKIDFYEEMICVVLLELKLRNIDLDNLNKQIINNINSILRNIYKDNTSKLSSVEIRENDYNDYNYNTLIATFIIMLYKKY